MKIFAMFFAALCLILLMASQPLAALISFGFMSIHIGFILSANLIEAAHHSNLHLHGINPETKEPYKSNVYKFQQTSGRDTRSS